MQLEQCQVYENFQRKKWQFRKRLKGLHLSPYREVCPHDDGGALERDASA